MAVVGSQRESICLSQDDVVYADQQSTSALKCPICQRIFSDPVITQCSHTFCRRCISNTVQCPFDQQIVQSFVSNQIIAEQIDALLVWCKYAFKKFPMSSNDTKNERDEYGCPVKIALKRKKEHEDECPYRFVSCPNACSLNNLRQKDLYNHLHTCSNRQTTTANVNSPVNHEHLQLLQQELISKMSQIDFLVNTCKQLTSTVALMRNEIDTLKVNQEVLCSRNDLLLSELMKTKQTSPIPTTIDEQESIRTDDSDDDQDFPSVILRCNGTFTGHNDTVWCLYALHDVLLSGSSDKTVKVWNLCGTPFTNLATLHGHHDAVLSLTVKERTVFSGGGDNSIFVWNLDDYNQTTSFVAHTDPVCSLAQYDNHLYSSSNRCLKVWDIETLQLFNEIATDTRNGWLRVLMQKDKCIYAGCRRGIKVFDATTHQISFEFELPTSDSIYSLAHSDTLLFSGASSGKIYVWDIRANRCLDTTCQHDATVHGLCMLSADKFNQSNLISASSDKTIRVWNVERFEQVQYDDRHEAEVTALHANARHIMSGATDAKIKVWDCTTSSHISKRWVNFVLSRSKTTPSLIPKAAEDLKEAAKEHVRELRREFDKPVKFSTSRAKYWDTADSIVFNRHIGKFTRPVLIVTILINMYYWGYYREENDIDDMLSMEPWQIFPRLNLEYLKTAERQYREAGLDTSQIEVKKKMIQDIFQPQLNNEVRLKSK
ncbi:unnamed protein product [Adineta ricciae]|uniref:Uncharacterized protein n=2 Tax=Adineta ricciae TaxID=249248 RepID=A0A814A9T2_ADIRI|nr:unnamed protein product [Adineta ricciae]